MLKFYMIFARKINKIPTCLHDICPKMPEFYITFAFFWGGGLLSPVFYAYGWAPGPHQLNPALTMPNPSKKFRQNPFTTFSVV